MATETLYDADPGVTLDPVATALGSDTTIM
jgi:hypothetical protein